MANNLVHDILPYPTISCIFLLMSFQSLFPLIPQREKKSNTHTHFIDGNWTNQQYCNCNLIFSQQLRQHCHNSSLILGYRVGKLLGSYNKTMTDWEVNIIDSYWVTWVWMNRFLLDWRPEELNSCWDNNFAIFFYKIV